ncbi:MAG TPA: hypothetical protein VHA05_01625 [Candidatus Saccharimonadales bacterium]|nr:hypothetical protein [Candidatus Saccharimonadales bacterium]
MRPKIARSEVWQVQAALLVAIGLQIVTRSVGNELLPGSQLIIILVELGLAILIGFTVNRNRQQKIGAHHLVAILLIGLISIINVIGLIYVLHSLIINHAALNGEELLASAIAIFATNIIVFALWYWEIDSPGMTGMHWSRHDKNFQFTQQDGGLSSEFPEWRAQFGDYLYLSVTNAVNFAPADVRPITLQAKSLMAAQSLISVFTLALVIARSVSILG